MKTIIGVKFRHQGKIYYFDPKGMDITRGQHVIVETQQGIEFAEVVISAKEVEDDQITGELRSIVRIATEDDFDQIRLNEKNEKDAIRICKEKILARELGMKLIKAEYAFDRSKLTFFFTADGRVDFRELVKDLASVFRTRIELRQVGVRDESRLIGGLGVCGRPLCCATWLPDFVPVSIKMAKEQNLSLNSAKISGVCGRLMCCLKNEAETYEYLNANLPAVGSTVRTIDGITGRVKSVDVLRQRVGVVVNEDEDEKEIRDYAVTELKFTPGRKKHEDADSNADSGEHTEQRERSDRRDRTERGERTDRRERNGRNDRQERGDRNERTERRNRNDRSDRNERNDRNDRGDRNGRNDHHERPEKRDQKNRKPRKEQHQEQKPEQKSEQKPEQK